MCFLRVRPDPEGDFVVNVREPSGAPPPRPSSHYGRSSAQHLLGWESPVRSSYTVPRPEVVQTEYRSPHTSRHSIRLPPVVHQHRLPSPSYQTLPAPEPYRQIPSPQPSPRLHSRDGHPPAPEAPARHLSVRESHHGSSPRNSSTSIPQRHGSSRSSHTSERRTERRSNDQVSLIVNTGREPSRGRTYRPRSEESRKQGRSAGRRPAIEPPPRDEYPWIREETRRRSYR